MTAVIGFPGGFLGFLLVGSLHVALANQVPLVPVAWICVLLTQIGAPLVFPSLVVQDRTLALGCRRHVGSFAYLGKDFIIFSINQKSEKINSIFFF